MEGTVPEIAYINDILSNPIKKSTIHKGIADLTVEEWTKKIQTTLLK